MDFALISASSDPYLYIIANGVLRIYSPVLDDPSWFQLLYSLDHRSFNRNKGKGRDVGTIWVPDTQMVKAAATSALEGKEHISASTREKLEAIDGEEMDLVLWFGEDGAVAARSILVRASRGGDLTSESRPQAAHSDTVHSHYCVHRRCRGIPVALWSGIVPRALARWLPCNTRIRGRDFALPLSPRSSGRHARGILIGDTASRL